MIKKAIYASPVGDLTIVSDGTSLLEVDFKDSTKVSTIGEDLIIQQTKKWLDSYFNHEKPSLHALPLKLEGSEFQQIVWKLLLDIPYGKLVTYGDLAKQVAKTRGLEKMSAQAVGGAVGRNPISIIVPCHRVIGTNGSLTGYGGGMKNKVILLQHEGIDLSNYIIPTKGTKI